jgi:hypothetical protein
MEAVAGANEAEQTPQGAEQTPPKPEAARAGQALDAAGRTIAEPATDQAGPAVSAAAQTTEQVAESASEHTPQTPGFGERGRMRRRARFLRKARELAYRDLGGLVFDLHRFGQRNDPLVLAKLGTLRQIDIELRELEDVLGDRRPVTVLREVGIAACPRCAAIHGSDDRFCPGCGLAFDANADRPISTAPVSQPVHTLATSQPSPLAGPAATASSPPSSHPAPPGVEPAPPVKPTAAPVAAKPSSPLTSPQAPSASPQVSPPTFPQASPPASPPASPQASPQASPPASPPASAPAPPPASAPTSPESHRPERPEEDEPTQVLRPPARGT